jgi:uncharacterized membrane protein YdfJ with MMPL/SSD domain
VPGAAVGDAQVSPDGRTAVVRLALDRPSSAMEVTDGEQLAELAKQAAGGGVQVAMGGTVPGLKAAPAMTAELVGVAVAALVLVLTFGAVAAAGLPLLVALFGVVIAVLFGGVLAAVLDTPDWSLLADAGVPVALGGQTASSVDQSDVTASRLPLFIGAVVLLSFGLLLGAFRAPLIALKASVMTVFSIVAAYGVVALIAEGGWAGQLVGIDTDVPVAADAPGPDREPRDVRCGALDCVRVRRSRSRRSRRRPGSRTRA